jgi:tetratricopeptide (TPR) repeat protein
MTNTDQPSPRQYKGVTISSTFQDLEEHRDALIDILKGHGLFPIAMEHDSARLVDVIDSSLQKVRDGAAYAGIISHRYGQVPECLRRNPDGLSITELEFNEAQRLDRPILLFVMGDDHPVRPADVELDPARRTQLQAFRERAKQMGPDMRVDRVYATFDNIEEFRAKAARAVAELDQYLQAQAPAAATAAPTPASAPASGPAPIPAPPAFYAEPPYIGSHAFVGRKAELDRLSDWAAAADPHPVLLFEAIGGTGKSMLTWEWTTKHATTVREDWAGRFWYSFYERGAIMADFCQRALAYITGRPLKEFRKKKTVELGDQLLRHLQTRPWLLVLDGLERVLVAYHRFDAAQVLDEQAGTSDQIAQRDPCDAIRPEDDELLRMLAGAMPSKLLLTSRLTPRVLLNKSGMAIPGVLRVPLPGLRPPDAEALLRACGITGSSQEIQNYLKSHCDCHPLVTGVLAGLINDYLPARGSFDAWASDPAGGRRLNLSNLDLVQKRNHILHTAIAALPPKSRELLSVLALLSESVDYETLCAINPHLPPQPLEVKPPQEPEKLWRWPSMSDQEKEAAFHQYREQSRRRLDFERAATARVQSPEFRLAPERLARTVLDLERRGLLQYDPVSRRHDLHPVVRGVAAGGLGKDERDRYGQRVVDYFSRQARNPYETAETLDDVRAGLHVCRALLQMGRYYDACNAFTGGLGETLQINLEAHAEILALLRPFFSTTWDRLPTEIPRTSAAVLTDFAGSALLFLNRVPDALAALCASLVADIDNEIWPNVAISLSNISEVLMRQNRLADRTRVVSLALHLAHQMDDEDLFSSRLLCFRNLTDLGRYAEAWEMWRLLDPMGRDWPRFLYSAGEAEADYARLRFDVGQLVEEDLVHAERLAAVGRSRAVIRELHRLRGEWLLERHEFASSSVSFAEAVRMAREIGQRDAEAETRLSLTLFKLGKKTDPRREAVELAQAEIIFQRGLAELWLATGDRDQASKHALAAYKHAWADGEPYVHRYELNKARGLLEQLGVPTPDLPPYDPTKDEKFPWEDAVLAAIEQIRAENEAADAESEDDDEEEEA